jgi:hypothetical protein
MNVALMTEAVRASETSINFYFALIMEAGITCETSVNFYQTTTWYSKASSNAGLLSSTTAH